MLAAFASPPGTGFQVREAQHGLFPMAYGTVRLEKCSLFCSIRVLAQRVIADFSTLMFSVTTVQIRSCAILRYLSGGITDPLIFFKEHREPWHPARRGHGDILLK